MNQHPQSLSNPFWFPSKESHICKLDPLFGVMQFELHLTLGTPRLLLEDTVTLLDSSCLGIIDSIGVDIHRRPNDNHKSAPPKSLESLSMMRFESHLTLGTPRLLLKPNDFFQVPPQENMVTVEYFPKVNHHQNSLSDPFQVPFQENSHSLKALQACNLNLIWNIKPLLPQLKTIHGMPLDCFWKIPELPGIVLVLGS